MLAELGWDEGWAALAAARGPSGTPARVARADRGHALLSSSRGGVRTIVPAGMTLVTGDWVLLDGDPAVAPDPPDPDATGRTGRTAGTIIAALPRRTELVRGAGRRPAGRQALAANVDVVLVVVSLATAPNPARLHRMLAVAWDSGAQPVVVLTKADLSRTAESERDEVAETALAAPVLLTSARDGRGLDELRSHLRPGRTTALLGAFAAGKSSLLTALAGPGSTEITEVGPDPSGRHLTVPAPPPRRTGRRRAARELVVLPGLGVLVDTPGLRGVPLWESDEGLERAFADVVELAGRCRFRDCRHAGEPGCAVAAAVADGTLSARRVASHAKLECELGWLRDRYDARLRAEQRRRWKEIARAMRSSPRR